MSDQQQIDDEQYGYGVAIDAGSSGSRIYVYRWPTSKTNLDDQFTKVEREAIYSEEVTPGISADNGQGIQQLSTLVNLAKHAIPSNIDISTIPIYLGATAGMRIIDSTYENEVMNSIQDILSTSGFQFTNDMARTISGKEEGIYDWLVANYLFNDGNFPTLNSAYGALDLGGASTQISFPIPSSMTSTSSLRGGESSVEEEDSFPLRIDNVEYPLYTQSFLYYGVDQARLQYDTKFASESKSNPCYPAGYTSESNIEGSSNWEECLSSVKQIFNQQNNTNCNKEGKRCLTNGGMHQLPISSNQKFIAMSAFVYTWDYLGLNIGPNTDDLDALNVRAQRVCNLNNEQQMGRYQKFMERKPDLRKTKKPYAQCFNAAFTYHLLSMGYGLPTKKTPIEIYYEIGGTKVQWALGLMLVEANKLGSMFKESTIAEIDIYLGDLGDTCRYLFGISVAILFILVGFRRLKKKRSTCDCEEVLPLIEQSETPVKNR